MRRDTEDMKLWLFDLAHGNIDDSQIIKGFLKYYVMFDLGIIDVQNDIVFHTHYGEDGTKKAMESLKQTIREFAE